jgi:catechol 2,3-dioxygenase-like lactoylglutathione lyase family enzyme
MSLKGIDNVAVVVDDLDAAIAFFSELGMHLEGRASLGGELVDRLVGLEGSRSEIAMMRAPDGRTGIELTRWEQPGAVGPDPRSAPANARGMGRVMFEVDDIDDVIERLKRLGGDLVGEIVDYEDSYRLCYLRGPEGIIVGLAQRVSDPSEAVQALG